MQYQPRLSHPHFYPSPAPAEQPSSAQNATIAFLLMLAVGMGGVLFIWSFDSPPPLSATLVISADKEAAEVSVNNEPIGIAEVGLPLVREVYPGKYMLRVMGKNGRNAIVREVEVKGAEVKTIHFGAKRERR